MGEGHDEWKAKHKRVRRVRRAHGLQAPLHPQQLLSWLLTIAFIALTFGAIIPALHSSLALPIAITSAILFLSHIIAHIVALTLDPADPQLRIRKKKLQIPEFDRNLHSHVIENGRCHLCNITITSSRTKHCSACNKCVDVFDHHCKWLNHCVGKRNYGAFMACVVTAIISCLLIMGTCIAEIVLYYFDREHLAPWENDQQVFVKYAHKIKDTENYDDPLITCDVGAPYCHFAVFGARVYDGAFIGIISAVFSAALIAEVLLIHLAAFHAYINFLGLTTYEYIRGLNLRDSSSAHSFNNFTREDTADPEGAVCGWTVSKRGPKNQITPSSTTDTALLSTPSYDPTTGSRSPRSTSTSPSTPNDGRFNFTPRQIVSQENTTTRYCKESDSTLIKSSSLPRTHCSSVPTLPQINKPIASRSRIGLRSVNRILAKDCDLDVEVRLVSIPRPKPSRRRMLKSSVTPHLSPIKECDIATASPPSLRGIDSKISENINSVTNSPARPKDFKLSDQISSPIMPSFSGPSSFNNVESPKSSLFSKSSPLRSPSHSQIYPRLSPAMAKTMYDVQMAPQIFVVNEHNCNSPVKVKSCSSPINGRTTPLKSSFRCISPVLNSPKLMTHINGKVVAITIVNGHIESAVTKSPRHQNGRLFNKDLTKVNGRSNSIKDDNSDTNFHSAAIDKKQIRNNISNSKSAKNLPNGTTHVELHM